MTENAVEPQTRPPESVSRNPDSRQASGQWNDNPSGLVSDAALKHLALSGQPFASEIADGEWFSDDTTREQLVDIKEALINGDDLLLVSGETGAGKSILLKQLSATGGTRIQCFSVRGSKRFCTFNLFSGLLEAFKLKPPAELHDTLKEVIPCLQALSERNMLGIIVLDDADRITDEELSLLLGSVQYLNGGEDPLLRILMAAEPEFESRIPELLPTSSDLPYASLSIEPFHINRAANYLGYRLSKVGDLQEFPFSDQQLHGICESANGLPSILNIAAAAEINQLHHLIEEGDDQYELVKEGPVLQNRPLKFALGALGAGLVLASAYLFINPTTSPNEGENYAIVSNKPINTNDSTQAAPQSDTIALVEEAETNILPPIANNNEIAGETATTNNDENKEITIVAVETTEIEPNSTKITPETIASTITPALVGAELEVSAASPQPESTTATIQQPSSNTQTATSETASQAAGTQSVTEASAEAADQETTSQAETGSAASVTETESANQEATSETSPASTNESSTTDLSGTLLESANWVLVQDPELYTVQMSASRERSSVESFLTRSKLAAPNSIFSFKRGDSTWYALIHGLYPTISDARSAIENMPAGAKRNQPWIRAIAQIQNSVKNQ